MLRTYYDFVPSDWVYLIINDCTLIGACWVVPFCNDLNTNFGGLSSIVRRTGVGRVRDRATELALAKRHIQLTNHRLGI